MMKDKLIDEKKIVSRFIKVNQLEWSKMLMRGLIIILFHPKLDKFYSVGAMNELKMIFYILFL